jgi:hypothetical protein
MGTTLTLPSGIHIHIQVKAWALSLPHKINLIGKVKLICKVKFENKMIGTF